MWQRRSKNGVKRVSAYSVLYDLCPPDASLVWGFLVVRLEWVHAKAALDRWIEENHLLREELGRIALFFRWAYQDWSDKANDLSQGEGERVICGYRAFTLRKADDYKRLVHNALDNLSLAGLDLPFQYL